ncbi:helix-turn-helix domain-containing protein, partial [Bradyrhizobium oligotrophicum]
MTDTAVSVSAEGPHSQLGHCLKAARQARGLTLKQVAEKTGMALSTLSKVENGLMSLTYDKLLQLTSGLQMDIAELFSPAAPRPEPGRPVTARRSLSRAGQGQVVATRFYTYTYQCTDLIGKRMVPMITEVRARTLDEFGPLLRHSGEEYFLVTRGTIAVHTEFYAPEILN